jgi:hypothetical protein
MTELIRVVYKRVPKTEFYEGMVMLVQEDSATNHSEIKPLIVFTCIPMEQVVTMLHEELRKHPEARAQMSQEISKSEAKIKKYKNHELDSHLVNTIRDNLEEALRMFAPIKREVIVRTL